MGKNQSDDGDLQHALEEAAETATRDPDDTQIAADDAGGTKLAEGVQAEEEAEAHPS